MQIEQKIPEQSIHSLMKDAKKYRKMMLIIQQTLYDMGYHESAKMLEKQSGVHFVTQQLTQIKKHLDNNDYERAVSVIQKQQQTTIEELDPQNALQKQNASQSMALQTQEILKKTLSSSVAQTKSMIYENYAMSKIINHQYEQAMTIISQNIKDEAKRQALCEALVLGNHNITQIELQKKKQQIFKFCLAEFQQIGQKQIEKVIESYAQHEGQNNKELKKLLSPGQKLPPMQPMAWECSEYIKHSVTHLKFNHVTSQLIAIDQGKDFQQILLLSFSQKNWLYQKQLSKSGQLSLKLKYPILTPIFNREVSFTYKGKRQSIQSVAFNFSNDNPMVAVASYSLIQLFDSKMDLITQIQAQNKIEKFIALQFHPLSDLLYTCGYFDTMQILDSAGQQVASINPYPKTRKFIFYTNQIIAISLVSSKVYKHSADEQVLLREKDLDENAIPMDLCLNQKLDQLVISSLQFLYLMDPETFQIMGKTLAPLNPGKLMIETRFYGDFLITLAKTFTCYEFSIDKTIESPKSYLITKIKEWSGEGTFDIHNQMMISGAKTIILWQEPNPDSLMDEESEFEEQIDPGQVRDMEGQDQDGEMIIDSDLQENQEDQNSEDNSFNDDDDEDISI